jgi:hypothetical protein
MRTKRVRNPGYISNAGPDPDGLKSVKRSQKETCHYFLRAGYSLEKVFHEASLAEKQGDKGVVDKGVVDKGVVDKCENIAIFKVE